MKEGLPFDDFVKEQFSNYSPNVPAHIWDNIIAKRRSRPKGFWTFGTKLLTGVLLLTGAGLFYYILDSGNQQNKTQEKNTQEKNITVQKQPSEIKNSQGSDEKDPADLKKQDIPVATDLNTDQPDQTSTITGNNNKSQTIPVIRFVQKNKNVTHPAQNEPGNESGKEQGKETTKDAGKETGDINSPLNTGNTAEKNEVIVNKVLFPFINKNARELAVGKVSGIRMPDCPALEKNAAGNKKYWEVYAGPDYAFTNYKTFGDTTSFNYLQKRKASTSFSSAFSAGVRYTKVFDNAMSIRTGVNYSQVNEKFVYFNPNEIKYITVITTRVIVRQPGDTIYINDTLQYQQTGTRTKTTYNRYHNVDIPLVIGYELGNGKVHANINAGVIINIYSWYKGDMLDSTYQPVSITTGKNNSVYQFKTNIGVGFLGSVSLYYKLNDNVHLLLEPYFRYNLSPMSKENLNLQEKFHTVGLRAGVRFDLK